MGLQDFLKDAKNIILGNSEDIGLEDFKMEIEKAVKEGIITKADAALLIQTRNNVKAEAKKLEEDQLTTISLEDGTKSTVKNSKKKKEELRLKKENEEKQRRISSDNVNKSNTRLKVERAKLQRELLKDEEQSKVSRNLGERDGKN